MYALISEIDYPDKLCIVSDNVSDLEEFALSLYGEDIYEWFCVLNEEEPTYISIDSIIRDAYMNALHESYDYNIVEATML